MSNKATNTRNRIMETAERIVLQKGFGGTSIDEVIGQAHITKGGFFYHFKGKNDLALGLIQRYLETDEKFFDSLITRARNLTEDPLQQMLLFLKLLAEAMSELKQSHPGCLVAAFTYESQQFDEQVVQTIKQGTLTWRRLFAEQLLAVEEKYSANYEVNVDDLADMLSVCLEGGILLSKILDDPRHLVVQILHYRDYLRLLYSQA